MLSPPPAYTPANDDFTDWGIVQARFRVENGLYLAVPITLQAEANVIELPVPAVSCALSISVNNQAEVALVMSDGDLVRFQLQPPVTSFERVAMNASVASWSNDGSHIAVLRATTESPGNGCGACQLVIVDHNLATVQEFSLPLPEQGRYSLSWSADDRFVLASFHELSIRSGLVRLGEVSPPYSAMVELDSGNTSNLEGLNSAYFAALDVVAANEDFETAEFVASSTALWQVSPSGETTFMRRIGSATRYPLSVDSPSGTLGLVEQLYFYPAISDQFRLRQPPRVGASLPTGGSALCDPPYSFGTLDIVPSEVLRRALTTQ